MKIGFDMSQTGQGKAGCGFFAHSLLKRILKHTQSQFVLYPSFGNFYFDESLYGVNEFKDDNATTIGNFQNLSDAAAFWAQDNLEKAIGEPDVVHANNFWCPKNLKSTRLIYTLYDLSFCVNPDWTTEANRIGCFEGVYNASLYADYIVAISNYSKQHFVETFPHYPRDRIKVIYPCSRFAEFDIQPQKPKNLNNLHSQSFWLSVGTIEPRKNQEMLIYAYKAYKEKVQNAKPLVFAGGYGWLMDDFKAKIHQNGLTEDIIFTGYVSDEEIVWLYRNCFGNLYPSYFEGFGLPVLEGMEQGAVTISSDCASLPEIIDDPSMTIAPDNINAWTDKMIELESDLVSYPLLKDRMIKSSEKINWDTSIAKLSDLYELAYHSKKWAVEI